MQPKICLLGFNKKFKIATNKEHNQLNKRNGIVGKCGQHLKQTPARYGTKDRGDIRHQSNRNHHIDIFSFAFVNFIYLAERLS